MLDGKVGSEEEQRDKGGGGEECPFPLSKGFGMLICQGERGALEIVFITDESVF